MSSPAPAPKSICILDYWGLGDATMMTAFARTCQSLQLRTTIVCKPASTRLLKPSFPEFDYIPFDPPWTAFRGKYQLWRWPWRELAALIMKMRRGRFDAIVSVRRDPRDQFLMRLTGIPRRVGIATYFSRLFLTDVVNEPTRSRPVVEDWQEIQRRLFPGRPTISPHLNRDRYRGNSRSLEPQRPAICLHLGARIPVRRWAPSNFRSIIETLRKSYSFDLVLIPDTDGHGSELRPIADHVLENLSLEQMTDAIGQCDLLLCNDSAPGHIADALGVPVVAIFGPTHPVRFRPYGPQNLVVIRDICPHRPCFDYCRFPEPICLTHLTPAEVASEVVTHIDKLIDGGQLPSALRKPA